MSSSLWDERPSPSQMSPRNAYRPNCESPVDGGGGGDYSRPSKGDQYDMDRRYGNDHGSVKNFDDDQHGSPKNYDSMGGYGGDGKAYGSDHGILKGHGSNHGSLKEFGSGDHGSNGAYYESERESRGRGGVKDPWRPAMSWIDRRSFCMGDSCASPPDWQNHPILRHVQPEEHQLYRQTRLEEWLTTAHKRRPLEEFGPYMWRASALANSELKQRKKQCFGDEYTNPVDKFVMRLFYGMKIRLERTESVILGVDEETFVLELLREECEDLYNNGQLYPDQRNIQYTAMLPPDMHATQERQYMGY